MKRTLWPVPLFALLLSLFVVSCTAPAPGAVTTTSEESAGLGDLIIAYPASLENAVMDRQVSGADHIGTINSFLTDSLVCRDLETNEFKPWLATSWELSEDGLQWTFQLREDVVFHDGTPFNAEAVKYNIERILDPETKSGSSKARLGPLAAVEVVDEFTVKITHETPYAAFLDGFAFNAIPIWSPTAATTYGLTDFPKHLTGSGPFIFKEQVMKDHFTVVRNPDYNWAPDCVDHEGPALLDSVTWKWVEEDAVRGGLLENGEAHLVDLPAQYVEDYENNPDFEVYIGYQAGTGLIWHMNTAKPPLNDLKVRQAILHSVNRDTINTMLYAGRYLKSYGPLTPVTPGYWEGTEAMYPYDVEKAAALLEEAGWTLNAETGIREKEGQPLTIVWAAINHPEMGEALAAQLKEVGIELTVSMVPGTLQVEMINNRSFDMMYYRLRGTDLLLMDTLWNPRNDRPGGYAMSGFKDEKLGELLDAANIEMDPEARMEYYVEAQQIIMENALALGMFDAPAFWGYSTKLKGFQVGASAVIYFPYMLQLEE